MTKINFSDISVQLIKFTFNSRFFLARTCQKIPLMAQIADKLFFEGDDIQVLPRDSTIHPHTLNQVYSSHLEHIEINEDIKVPEDVILPSEVLKVMIEKSKYHFIMNSCICRVSNECKDYPTDLGCLFLGAGASRISDKLGRRASTDEALKHIKKCHDAGLVHIIGRNKIDSVWLNTGPKEELLSICHCCPCCCLWKMAPDLPAEIGKGFIPMVGVELIFNHDSCLYCGKCSQNICFVDAIKTKNGHIEIDFNTCRCCGRCAEICPNNAIVIKMSDSAVSDSVERVEKLVDVESTVDK